MLKIPKMEVRDQPQSRQRETAMGITWTSLRAAYMQIHKQKDGWGADGRKTFIKPQESYTEYYFYLILLEFNKGNRKGS